MNGAHPGTSLRRSAAVLSVASLGLVLGHWLTYAMEIPDPGLRASVLADTGHAYLSTLAQLAAVAAVAGLGTLFLGNLVRSSEARSFRQTFAMLAAFQIVAFVSMEVMERVVAGAPLFMLALTAILPIGALFQALIATVGALLIRWVLRAAERASSRDRTVPVRFAPVLGPILATSDRRAALLVPGATGNRGPPSSSPI